MKYLNVLINRDQWSVQVQNEVESPTRTNPWSCYCWWWWWLWWHIVAILLTIYPQNSPKSLL